MVNKKIKKSALTLGGLVFSVIIVMAVFFGFYLFINSNATESGRGMPSQYNETYTKLQSSQSNLSTNIDNVRYSLNNVTEADSGFAAAWNGLKGLLAVAKLPLNFINIVWQSYQLMTVPLNGFLPIWAKNLIDIGIVAAVVFIVWSIMKGDPKIIE